MNDYILEQEEVHKIMYKLLDIEMATLALNGYRGKDFEDALAFSLSDPSVIPPLRSLRQGLPRNKTSLEYTLRNARMSGVKSLMTTRLLPNQIDFRALPKPFLLCAIRDHLGWGKPSEDDLSNPGLRNFARLIAPAAVELLTTIIKVRRSQKYGLAISPQGEAEAIMACPFWSLWCLFVDLHEKDSNRVKEDRPPVYGHYYLSWCISTMWKMSNTIQAILSLLDSKVNSEGITEDTFKKVLGGVRSMYSDCFYNPEAIDTDHRYYAPGPVNVGRMLSPMLTGSGLPVRGKKLSLFNWYRASKLAMNSRFGQEVEDKVDLFNLRKSLNHTLLEGLDDTTPLYTYDQEFPLPASDYLQDPVGVRDTTKLFNVLEQFRRDTNRAKATRAAVSPDVSDWFEYNEPDLGSDVPTIEEEIAAAPIRLPKVIDPQEELDKWALEGEDETKEPDLGDWV